MLKRIFRILKGITLLVVICVFSINLHVNATAEDYLFYINDNIPKATYGLVLGTSKFVMGGGKNVYYQERIEVAATLFNTNKIDTIIVSGDNREADYNEPKRMKASLMELGIPVSFILEDKKGINTLQSIKNFKVAHPNKNLIIITQKAHNQRAVYYAHKNNINVIGINTSKTHFLGDTKMFMREYLAKVKAFLV